MEAAELRLGNYIYDDFDEVHRVECTKSDMLVSIDTMGAEQVIFSKVNNKAGLFVCNKIKPIPLTEEWLLKLGFEKNMLTSLHLSFIWYGPDNLAIKGMLGSVKPYNIKYVHQLQNLHFALTGEELTLKL